MLVSHQNFIPTYFSAYETEEVFFFHEKENMLTSLFNIDAPRAKKKWAKMCASNLYLQGHFGELA